MAALQAARIVDLAGKVPFLQVLLQSHPLKGSDHQGPKRLKTPGTKRAKGGKRI